MGKRPAFNARGHEIPPLPPIGRPKEHELLLFGRKIPANQQPLGVCAFRRAAKCQCVRILVRALAHEMGNIRCRGHGGRGNRLGNPIEYRGGSIKRRRNLQRIIVAAHADLGQRHGVCGNKFGEPGAIVIGVSRPHTELS